MKMSHLRISLVSALLAFAGTNVPSRLLLAQPVDPQPVPPTESHTPLPSTSPLGPDKSSAKTAVAATPAGSQTAAPVVPTEAASAGASIAVPPVAIDEPLPAPASAPSAIDEPAPTLPDKIAVGHQGWLQPSVLLQFWLWGTRQDKTNSLTFRVRRAEIKLKGEIIPDTVGYGVMVDPSKVLEFQDETIEVQNQEPEPTAPGTVTVAQPRGNVSILQDFYISFLSEYADVSVGQFKVPISLEGYGSSSQLLFPERSLVARAYGDRRDVGISAEKKLGPLHYVAGIYNGEGANLRDSNNQKDAALRLEVTPFDGLLLAGVGYLALGQRDQAGTKDRVEADVRFSKANLLIQGEYIHAWDQQSDKSRRKGQGFYGALGYTVGDKLQPIVRVGMLDPDTSLADNETWHYEIGANYYLLDKQARLGLSASLFDPAGTVNTKRKEIILMTQASF